MSGEVAPSCPDEEPMVMSFDEMTGRDVFSPSYYYIFYFSLSGQTVKDNQQHLLCSGTDCGWSFNCCVFSSFFLSFRFLSTLRQMVSNTRAMLLSVRADVSIKSIWCSLAESAVRLTEVVSFIVGDFPLCLHVEFVSNQNGNDVRV